MARGRRAPPSRGRKPSSSRRGLLPRPARGAQPTRTRTVTAVAAAVGPLQSAVVALRVRRALGATLDETAGCFRVDENLKFELRARPSPAAARSAPGEVSSPTASLPPDARSRTRRDPTRLVRRR